MSKKSRKFSEISADIRERERKCRAVLRLQIYESRGDDRCLAWELKRQFGANTRHLLLAYALIRSVPYVACERKTSVKPYICDIESRARSYGYEVTADMVKDWLDGKPIPRVVKQGEAPDPRPPVVKPPRKDWKREGFFLNLFRRFAHG